MPKASQAENSQRFRLNNKQTHISSEYQNIRLSEKQRSRYQCYREAAESKRGAIQKIHRKIPKKFAKSLEQLRPYRKIHIENPKKILPKVWSMRFLPISLPSLLYVDSSPLVLYPRLCPRPLGVSETRLCFTAPFTVSEHRMQISDTWLYSSHVTIALIYLYWR